MPKQGKKQGNKGQSANDGLNRKNIIEAVVAKSGLSQQQAKAATEAVFQTIRAGLEAEKKIAIQGFGKLIPKRAMAGTEKEKMIYRVVLAAKGDEADED